MSKSIKRSGAYAIKNNVNGKFYVGSSKNIDHRWAVWRYNFKRPMKYKSLLKAAVTKYGIENFTFFVLEECEPTSAALETIENKYIDIIRPQYNICLIAYSPKGITHPHTEETKIKIRIKRALQINVKAKGFKHAMPAWNKGLPSPTKGIPRTAEVIAKISKTKMGHFVSEETKRKISVNNARTKYWLGKKRPQKLKIIAQQEI